MPSPAQQFVGATAYDMSGHKIGKIQQIFVDVRTRQPKWVVVNHGLFGRSAAHVPLAGAYCGTNAVTVAVEKQAVKEAPQLRVRAGITPEDEHRLQRHYDLPDPPLPAPEPPPRQSHNPALDIAAAAAGIGGTAMSTVAYPHAQDAEKQ